VRPGIPCKPIFPANHSPLCHPGGADSLRRVGRSMTGQQRIGCPTSRSFFGDLGYHGTRRANSIGCHVLRSEAEGSAVSFSVLTDLPETGRVPHVRPSVRGTKTPGAKPPPMLSSEPATIRDVGFHNPNRPTFDYPLPLQHRRPYLNQPRQNIPQLHTLPMPLPESKIHLPVQLINLLIHPHRL
jgi:hypothetical protein